MEDSKIIIEKLNEMNEKIGSLDERVGSLDERVESLAIDVKNIRLDIEGSIWNNINVLHDGHVDLYRKLDEAQKVEHEKEIMEVRIIHLENEMVKVKRVLAEQLSLSQ